MKKLIVCGDSFMSPRLHVSGTHFTEIFAKELNFELVVYARSASSNGGIALQILQAIKDRPDLIVFNTTQSDRIEFPINSSSQYKGPIKLADVDYSTYSKNELSVVQHNFQGNVLSDNLMTLLNNPETYAKEHKLPIEKMQAVKNYFEELYIENWKWQQDCMMMYYVLHQLHISNIPYLWCHDFLHMNTGENGFYPNWLNEKSVICDEIHSFRMITPEENHYDPGYHTSIETQKLIADFVIDHYNKYFTDV